jgi:hypothetical protein
MEMPADGKRDKKKTRRPPTAVLMGDRWGDDPGQPNYLPVDPDQALTALAYRQAVPPSGSRIRVIYRAPSVELASLPHQRVRTTFGMIKPRAHAPFAFSLNSFSLYFLNLIEESSGNG